MSKKRIIIFVTTILLLCIIGIILSFVNAFSGNPISAGIATKKIKSYVKETYSDMDLEISEAKYNFKFKTYNSKVQSRTSQDTNFTVEWSEGSIYDSYDYDVLGRYKTYDRLSTEFDNKVEEIINKEFEYETSILIADFGKAEVDLNKVTLDMPFDIKNPPLPTYLTIYLFSEEISYEFLSARLLQLNTIMEQQQIPIDVYSVVIEEPKPEGDDSAPRGESLYLFDFPANKIMSEDLIAEMKEHQKAYEAENKK